MHGTEQVDAVEKTYEDAPMSLGADSKCGSFRIFKKSDPPPPPLLHGHNLSGGQYMASVARACSVLGGIMPHRRDSITWEQSPAPLLPALSRKF